MEMSYFAAPLGNKIGCNSNAVATTKFDLTSLGCEASNPNYMSPNYRDPVSVSYHSETEMLLG
jgi:hypothetical protein